MGAVSNAGREAFDRDPFHDGHGEDARTESMHDRHDGTFGILIVDDRPIDSHAWSREAARLDVRLVVRSVDNAVDLQKAILEGGWRAALCQRAPTRLSLSAVLAMIQVLEPAPVVLLYADVTTGDDHRGWLSAALRAAGYSPLTSTRTALASRYAATETAGIDVPSIFGPSVTFTGSDVEALRALRDSEERFRTLTEIAPVGIFLTDAAQLCVYANERWSQITGIAARDARGMDWRACLQMDGDALQATALFATEPTLPLAFESRIDRPGREPVWVIGQMRPYRDSAGQISGHLGVITDITDRKASELAIKESEARLRELSAHMTSAEERQRALIAREIHDDIGSSLTGMKIDVGNLRVMTRNNEPAQEKLAAFTRLLDSVAASTTRIAKSLRPSILDDGIVPAIEWQCREFSKRMDIDVEFVEPDTEPQLTADQSIALFRVVQEALNNVAKHAQARSVDVVLFAQANELTLEIRDDGKGLPRETQGSTIERMGGFGITGMRERILSLGGWMDVAGAPGKGTTVMVGIPMNPPA